MVPPPTSMQTARELAGSVWVPSWAGSVRVTGWGYISSGCSSGSHTTFHASPRGRPWTPLRQGHPDIHPGHPTSQVFGALLVGALARWTWDPRFDASQGAWGRPGPPWDPRTAAPAPLAAQRPHPLLPDSLPSAAPPICPSFAANWRMLRAHWDRLPEPLSPSPLARGGPPRGEASPQSPPPRRDRFPWLTTPPTGAPSSHQARGPGDWRATLDGRLGGPGPCRVARCQATVPLPLRCATIDSTSTHHAPVKVKQAHVPAQSLPPCHAIDHIGRRGPLPYRLTDPRWPRIVRADVPRSRLDSQGHDHAYKVGHRRPAGRVLPSPPSLPTGEDRGALAPRHPVGPGVDRPPGSSGPGRSLGAPSLPGITTPQATQGPGWATHHRPSPPLPSNAVNWQRAGHIGIAPPGTQALRLTLSGQGPRPAHPANWRRVLDVERRPSSALEHP